MLKNLQIKGFRAFRDLSIPVLGRVNLIVGKNNIGKTTVLEAIKVLAAGSGAPWHLLEVLEARQEVERESVPEFDPGLYWSIRRAFHVARDTSETSKLFSIGPLDSPHDLLTVRLAWVRQTRQDDGTVSRVMVEAGTAAEDEDVSLALVLDVGSSQRRVIPMTRVSRRRIHGAPGAEPEIGTITCQYIAARGFEGREAGDLWDSIVLTEREQDVLAALQIIEPDIDRVSIIESKMPRSSRLALVKRRSAKEPEPLKSMGDGMQRVFEMALGLANAKSGILLIDEVDNGVHYSVQEQLWSFIFEAASRLSVQVFATTHSWDCIESFQRAASAHAEDGFLVRLDTQDGDIRAVTLSEKDLEIVTRESIEVR